MDNQVKSGLTLEKIEQFLDDISNRQEQANHSVDYLSYEQWCLTHWIFRHLDVLIFKNPLALHYWDKLRLKAEDLVYKEKPKPNHPFQQFFNNKRGRKLWITR